MAKRMTTEHETYLTITEAARLIGVDRNSLRRFANRHGIPTYTSPMDARLTLFALADLEQLTTPKPAVA